VGNFLEKRISQVSIEKLLRYVDRLRLHASIAVHPMDMKTRCTKIRGVSIVCPITKEVADAV
jgi:hypothetical protein